MAEFQFLHAADIHLDSPMTGLGHFEEASADKLKSATREALENLVQTAIDEEVAFVIFAGDLYDGEWKDHRTGLFFVRQMGRLNEAGIAAFILKGNHDAESQIAKSVQLPGNVKVFDHRKPESIEVDGFDVVLHGQSFPEQHLKDNLVPNYPSPVEGKLNIGVLHTGLEGGTMHAHYAPCSVVELTTKGYDYWALGHVHEHKIIASKPYIVYPGNLQGRNVRETGPKGACLVSVEGGEISSVEHVPLDVARWAWINVDVSGVETFDEVIDGIAEGLDEAIEQQSGGRLLACRLSLVGETPLDGELRTRQTELRAEATGITLRRGDVEAWVEKIRVETSSPMSADEMAQRADLLGEVLDAIPGALDDEDFVRELKTTLQSFITSVRHEVQKNSDDPLLRAALEEDYETLLNGVRGDIAALLMRQGE